MTTDYRALCAEILQKLDQYEDGQRVNWDAWRNNVRTALAQPYSDLTEERRLGYLKGLEDCAHAALAQHEPEEPTDEDVRKILMSHGILYQHQGYLLTAGNPGNPRSAKVSDIALVFRAVLARWGTPANSTREENLEVSND
jgi:hypothetical protein